MKISSILLAGGQSKRMGEDKAFLRLGNKTFLRIIGEKLSKYCDQIVISGNKEKELYLNQLKGIDKEIVFIKDIHPYEGPLNGIVSCRKQIKNEFVFIATCDTPLLNEELIPFFCEKIEDYDVIIPVVNGKYQFLNTLYRTNSFKKAEEIYKKGNKSLYSWVKNLKIKEIPQKSIEILDEKLYSYWSINTKEDYIRLKNIWGK